MTGHVHADLMLLYAQQSKTDNNAWRNWSMKHRIETCWARCAYTPSWDPVLDYKHTPPSINININGYDVPCPERVAPPRNTQYYVPHLRSSKSETYSWDNDGFDRGCLDAGMVHLTREAATIHAQALASFTKLKP